PGPGVAAPAGAPAAPACQVGVAGLAASAGAGVASAAAALPLVSFPPAALPRVAVAAARVAESKRGRGVALGVRRPSSQATAATTSRASPIHSQARPPPWSTGAGASVAGTPSDALARR